MGATEASVGRAPAGWASDERTRSSPRFSATDHPARGGGLSVRRPVRPLWFLQVINAPKAQAAAENNGIRLVYTPAPRGLILDRNGNVLVGNVNEPVIEVSRLVGQPEPGHGTAAWRRCSA